MVRVLGTLLAVFGDALSVDLNETRTAVIAIDFLLVLEAQVNERVSERTAPAIATDGLFILSYSRYFAHVRT